MSANNASDKGSERRPRPGRKRSDEGIDAPTLGYIPPDPASPTPALSDPMGDASTAYLQTLDRIQAATTARILMVAAAGTAPLATPAALNLGIAATRLGLRAVVIDGDEAGTGPSQYLRTGRGPGLTDLAAGTVDLTEASRLLTIDASNRLPMIPAGTPDSEPAFDASALADPIDRIHEHSDLILVVTSAATSEQRMEALGAHADGTLLVVNGSEQPGTVAAAAERLASVGAPVTGLIELALPKGRKRRSRGS
jgi:tyrosine-protein kinase Etk/Wzc